MNSPTTSHNRNARDRAAGVQFHPEKSQAIGLTILRIFVALEPCDMRKGFEGLHALASGRLGEEVKSGALFVFTNKRRTRLKVLYWDGTGLWLLTKRLEAGTFSWPRSVEPGAGKLLLKPEAFAMLTDGIDLRGAQMRPWYERGA